MPGIWLENVVSIGIKGEPRMGVRHTFVYKEGEDFVDGDRMCIELILVSKTAGGYELLIESKSPGKPFKLTVLESLEEVNRVLTVHARNKGIITRPTSGDPSTSSRSNVDRKTGKSKRPRMRRLGGQR